MRRRRARKSRVVFELIEDCLHDSLSDASRDVTSFGVGPY